MSVWFTLLWHYCPNALPMRKNRKWKEVPAVRVSSCPTSMNIVVQFDTHDSPIREGAEGNGYPCFIHRGVGATLFHTGGGGFVIPSFIQGRYPVSSKGVVVPCSKKRWVGTPPFHPRWARGTCFKPSTRGSRVRFHPKKWWGYPCLFLSMYSNLEFRLIWRHHRGPVACL